MDSTQFITLRVQRKFAEEVRRIAAREATYPRVIVLRGAEYSMTDGVSTVVGRAPDSTGDGIARRSRTRLGGQAGPRCCDGDEEQRRPVTCGIRFHTFALQATWKPWLRRDRSGALSGFAAGRLGCTATARHLLCRATLSSFLLEFDSKGFGFFDAAVQLFEQGRHLKWDLRAHRSLASYRMAVLAAVQNSTVEGGWLMDAP